MDGISSKLSVIFESNTSELSRLGNGVCFLTRGDGVDLFMDGVLLLLLLGVGVKRNESLEIENRILILNDF